MLVTPVLPGAIHVTEKKAKNIPPTQFAQLHLLCYMYLAF